MPLIVEKPGMWKIKDFPHTFGKLLKEFPTLPQYLFILQIFLFMLKKGIITVVSGKSNCR